MSTFSKRVKVHPDVLLEYIFDDSNYKSEDYNIITNLKEKTKSYLSESTINNQENSLFLVDPILSKYSNVDTDNFNFIRKQNYFTSPIVNDKLKIYLPSGFDFYSDYIGFYVNVYTYGYDNNTKYSLTNFYYTKDNIDSIKLFDLPTPFYFDEKFWVRSIDIEFPSIDAISTDRIISGNVNGPKPDTINDNLTYGEGLSINAPIFIDFTFITSTQTVLDVPYYYTGDLYSVSLAQTPEFTELGVSVLESTQGDYFEIYGTYLGSNENMDEFAYKQEITGNQIQLEYIINLFEENILTTTQTYQVTENFTQKILYRPVIQFSNTTASIDVELRIVSLIDGSYISKFGSLGITDNINKYGLRLTQLNLSEGVINSEIFNLKVNNTMTGGSGVDSYVDVMKVPYPVMIDKYRILTKTTNATLNQTNDYVTNGLLEVLITPFDNIIQFNIAQDINSDGDPIPYDLSSLSTNSNLKMVFKSDSEKLEKEPFYEAENNYEIGILSYKIQEKDNKLLKRIYDKGYDNFYLVVTADGVNTQLYSGKYIFYEDVTFVQDNQLTETTTTGTTESTSDQVILNTENIDSVIKNDTEVDKNVQENNPFVAENMDIYVENPEVDKNYTNLMVYVRFQTNIDKMDAYLKTENITPKIKYGNIYFLERIYKTEINDIKSQNFIEKVFEIPIATGEAPKEIYKKEDKISDLRIFREPKPKPEKPIRKPYTPSKPSVKLNKYNSGSRSNLDLDLDRTK
jgi:hypothetical protein